MLVCTSFVMLILNTWSKCCSLLPFSFMPFLQYVFTEYHSYFNSTLLIEDICELRTYVLYIVLDSGDIAVVKIDKIPALIEFMVYFGHIFCIAICKAISFFKKLDTSVLLCYVYVPQFIQLVTTTDIQLVSTFFFCYYQPHCNKHPAMQYVHLDACVHVCVSVCMCGCCYVIVYVCMNKLAYLQHNSLEEKFMVQTNLVFIFLQMLPFFSNFCASTVHFVLSTALISPYYHQTRHYQMFSSFPC